MDPTRPRSDQSRELDDVDGWVASLRVDQATSDRARAGWLVRQAEEEGSLVGVLSDLAEQGYQVLVHLRNGRRHRGALRVVGSDFCAILTDIGRDVLIAYRDIASVRTRGGSDPIVGDRVVTASTSLREALAALAGTAHRVLVMTGDANDAVGGELRSVGRDLATLRLDGNGGWAYVPLASVAEVTVLESG